ncbi:hypothetical protein F0L74_29235 [Chitinophaga agrisoli]|uniref:Uncharacterized protein n=1 Tax=Chitinophaga agrisoli TaxID=2607653 RepID=A0A5B2VMG8_9BACT|nr:hypothetical protein [Chitinophaga agrisoli]KAA2240251.1 hypothetical protein F0L74_29235 [Chitinophaga agrisoli]
MNRSLRIAAKLLVAGCLALGSITVKAQLKVGTNPTVIQKSAILELESDRQGLLLPRLTDTAAINAITPAPLDGMIIFLSKTPHVGLYVRTGGHWEQMADNGTATGNWTLTGNAATDPTKNFIGTTDAKELVIKANNTEAIRVATTGDVQLKQVGTGAVGDLEVLVLGTGGTVMRRTISATAFTSAINSLNGSTGAAQTIAAGSAGTDFGIADAGNVHTINIPTQDGSATRGLLTQADWNKLNNAQKTIVIGTFSTAPIPTGLSLDAAGNLVLHAADATNPGAVSVGAQTFAGAKTFQDDLVASGKLNVTGATTLGGALNITNAPANAATAENDVLIRTASGLVLKKTLNPAAFDGAIQKINGQTGPAVSFKTGTAGTDVALDSTTTTNVITLNVPDAAVGARGVVNTQQQAFKGAKSYDSVMVGGAAVPNSTLQVDGSVSMAIRRVTANTTVGATDNTILVVPSAPVTVTLPAATAVKGRIYTIKKILAGVVPDNIDNSVTIDVAGGGQIEGGSSYAIYNAWTFVTVQSDGVAWFIIKK